MKIIVVTGTPGTGKTALSRKIANKLNLHYIDVNNVIRKYKIAEGYDQKMKTKIVDIKKLNKALIMEISQYKKTIKNKPHKSSKKNPNEIKNGIIIDSHLSHYLAKKYVDLCIVTKCDLKVLRKRLKKRKYSEEKVRENLDAEIFDVCLNEAMERKHNIIVLDMTKGVSIDKVYNKLKKQ